MLSVLSVAKCAALVSRWWTPQSPVLTPAWWYEPADGWRYPLIPVTAELVAHKSQHFDEYFANHRRVHHDFDRDCYIYAWWPIAPAARVAYWWRQRRWCAERWLNHRVVDVAENDYLSNWKLRSLRSWTWRRTQPSVVAALKRLYRLAEQDSRYD